MKTLLALVLAAVAGLVYWTLRDDIRVRGSDANASVDAPPPAPASPHPDDAVRGQTDPAPPTPAAATAPPTSDTEVAADAATSLLIPVQGVSSEQLHDTFTDARSEGRAHDAIDIMAAAGTPVLAVADGTIEKLFYSQRGGLTIYQFEPSGRFAYYYAHLQRYADGLAEKQTIRRGQVIGYVGSTGNADPAAPHLHFEVHRLGPEQQWWKGESINPYPLLRQQAEQR